MIARDEALQELKGQLDKIKENKREQIHLITLMADDYADYADDVVKLIVDHIKAAPCDMKLLGVYVLDSIIKFSGNAMEKYRRLFNNEIVMLFVDAFEKAPTAHRKKLYKVRSTWKTIFLKSKLFDLDSAVHKFDKSWPVLRQSDKAAAPPADDVTIKNEAASTSTSTESKLPPVAEAKNDPKFADVKKENAQDIPKPLPSRRDPRIAAKAVTIKTEPAMNDPPKLQSSMKRNSNNQRIIPEKKRRIDSEHHHTVEPTATLGSHAFLPPPPVLAIPPPSMMLMPPPSSSVSSMDEVFGPNNISPKNIKTEIDDFHGPPASLSPPPQLMHNFSQPPPSIPCSSSSMFPPTSMASVITNETPKLNGAALNNRIFVGGRAYEVIFVNNVAVIEQNGLPHRVFFSGTPRDILIDGSPFKLGFDQVRVIHIDAVPHPVRFGAPSRELYIGNHPFKGTFGGPPMIANINGRRHEIRLCGPPPEVRIDQDPCYELSRHMNAVRAPQSATPKPEEKLVEKKDVFALLQKIKKHGILKNKQSSICKAETPSPMQKPSTPVPRMTGIIPRGVAPPPSIKTFQIGALMVRYSEVVEALHQSRIACPHCGIGFDENTSQAYQRHIDVHVQELLKTKAPAKSRFRQWYMKKNEWLEFDEAAEVQKVDEDKCASSNSTGDAIAATSLNKVCSVCHLKFNEYFDNDEEEWRFQDCVVKGSIAVHRSCVEQMVDRNEGIEKDENAQQKSALLV